MLNIVVEVDTCIAKVECMLSGAILTPRVRDAQKTPAGTWNASSAAATQIIATQPAGDLSSLRGRNRKFHTNDCHVSSLLYNDLNSVTRCLLLILLFAYACSTGDEMSIVTPFST